MISDEQFEAARKLLNWGQMPLAEAADLGVETVIDVETGDRLLTPYERKSRELAAGAVMRDADFEMEELERHDYDENCRPLARSMRPNGADHQWRRVPLTQ